MEKSKGYDPIIMAKKTEDIVVSGNRRKYVQLGRHLRFYGGTSSATEVGCNLRCKFCFSHEPVWKPETTGKFYSPEEVFKAWWQMRKSMEIKLYQHLLLRVH